MISNFFPRKFLGIFILFSSLIAASLACNLPQRTSTEATPIPISPASAQELEQNIQKASEEFLETGRLELTITELQLTSLVAEKISSQAEASFTNPQIKLQDGQIQVSGDLPQNGILLPVKANLSVAANEQGNLDYDFLSASLGPLSLPENIVNQISDYVRGIIDQNITTVTGNLFIEEVTIADGVMIIKGHSR